MKTTVPSLSPSPRRDVESRHGAEEPLIELRDVGRRYDQGGAETRALRGVSLRIPRGELVAVVGPSGCGKSTLLNVLAAVDRADEGEVRVSGHDLVRSAERDLVLLRRRSIGVVFQAFHLMPNLSATENVALPLALDGRREPERVAELLERVGLAHRAHHHPSELSGGEQQRVAVARALVHRPELVVADEPTGNLDSKSGAEVLELLVGLRREEGATLVMATHDLAAAERADRVVHLVDGRVVEVRVP